MADLEYECLKLGIPVKTRHNEVAPNQFELAPVYEECNLANDHNQLLMTIMDKIARRHNFRVLLHEKPFKGINGSGKHNNWSLGTDTGVNLLSPGKTASENLQFITFLVNVISAVHKHNGLLKAAIMSATNSHRLGANEAPPAIISVYLGEQLEDVLSQLISTGEATHSLKGGKLQTGVRTLPDSRKMRQIEIVPHRLHLPEISSSSVWWAPEILWQRRMSVLNTIVAEVFQEVCDELEKAEDFDMKVHDLIKAVCF